MDKKLKVSVVMASYNEEKAIGKMIDEIRKYTKEYDTEILIVDSSKDKTPEIAKEKGAKVIWQEPKGHGIALRTAINEAKGDFIITSDCDNTYPMEYIPVVMKLVNEDGYDLVSCNRLTRQLGSEMPFSNKLANKGFAFLVKVLYRIDTRDVTTGMFCMKKEVKNKIKWETNFSFPCEIIVRTVANGFKYKEIDIPYLIRVGEVTLNKWRSGKAYIKCIFNYKFNLKIDPKEL